MGIVERAPEADVELEMEFVYLVAEVAEDVVTANGPTGFGHPPAGARKKRATVVAEEVQP